MNTTPGAPTDAQIDALWSDAVRRNGTTTGTIREVIRAVLSLPPAPSAALAASVASPEPVPYGKLFTMLFVLRSAPPVPLRVVWWAGMGQWLRCRVVRRSTHLCRRSSATNWRDHRSELDGRKKRETNQDHADRISSAMQENEDRRNFLREIDEVLALEAVAMLCVGASHRNAPLTVSAAEAMVRQVVAESRAFRITPPAEIQVFANADRRAIACLHPCSRGDEMSGTPTLTAQQSDELPGAYWDAKARSLYENSFTSGLEWPLYSRLPDVEKAYWVARAALASGATQPSDEGELRALLRQLCEETAVNTTAYRRARELLATPPTGEPLTAPSENGINAFNVYLTDCEAHAIEPDLGGAFHWAWTHRAALATPLTGEPHPPRVTEAMMQQQEGLAAEAMDTGRRLAKLRADLDEASGEPLAAPGDCPNCFEGKSDMQHTCRECNGTGLAALAATAAPTESEPKKFGSGVGITE